MHCKSKHCPPRLSFRIFWGNTLVNYSLLFHSICHFNQKNPRRSICRWYPYTIPHPAFGAGNPSSVCFLNRCWNHNPLLCRFCVMSVWEKTQGYKGCAWNTKKKPLAFWETNMGHLPGNRERRRTVKRGGETPPEYQRGTEDFRRFEEWLWQILEAQAISRSDEKGGADDTNQSNIWGIVRNLWHVQNSRKNAAGMQHLQCTWDETLFLAVYSSYRWTSWF